MRALNIVETAYRATLEEQDDTIIWLNHAMKGAGAELAVLLRGNAVNYAVRGQEVTPLSFGGRTQKHAPDIPGQLAGLVGKGVDVFVEQEALESRGLTATTLVDGLKPVARSDLPGLFEAYEQVWHW